MTTETHVHTARCWYNPDEARWECRAAHTRPLVDVRDMVVVHTAMLREFRLAPQAVRRAARGDGVRVRDVAGHLDFLGAMLHHHHDGEDRLLWPAVRARVPAGRRHVLDTADAQHQALDAALGRVGSLVAAWASPDPAAAEPLAGALDDLHALLSEHLDFEERALLPLAAAVLTEAEWRAVGEQAVASTPKPDLLLQFGMFTYEGDPAVLRDMLRTAPPPVRVLLPRIAPRVYARRARRVHGTVRP